MKVLYCTNTPIAISETFLQKTLNYLCAQFEVEIISSAAKGDSSYPCRCHFLDLRKNELQSRITSLLNLILFSKSKEQSHFDIERKAISKFFKTAKITADAAVIEYGTSAYKFARALNHSGIPYVICFHGYDASAYLGFEWYVREVKSISNAALMNVVPSNHLRRRLQLIGVKRDLITVEPCAPNYDSLPRPHAASPFYITSLGRLTGKKLPQALLYSAKLVLKKHPDVQFKVIGDGPLMDECKQILEDLDMAENFDMLGAMEHTEALEILSQASIFMQHSVTSSHGDQEGFPVSIAEASALGVPVVSTLHSGIPEGVIDGTTGFLVQEHDFEAMAEKLIMLIESEMLRLKMGAAGAKNIRDIAPDFRREATIVRVLRG